MAANTSQVVKGSDCHILDAQFVLAAPVTASQNGVDFFPLRIVSRGRLITKGVTLILYHQTSRSPKHTSLHSKDPGRGTRLTARFLFLPREEMFAKIKEIARHYDTHISDFSW